MFHNGSTTKAVPLPPALVTAWCPVGGDGGGFLLGDHLGNLSVVVCVEKNGVIYDAHLSDKFEPFAVVSATHRETSKILRLNPQQLVDLDEALSELRRKYSISGETYHYTSYKERMATDAFVDWVSSNWLEIGAV